MDRSCGGMRPMRAFVCAIIRSALATALPLHAPTQLHERSQWDSLLRERVPPVLPAQPPWQCVGTYELWARREQRHGALAESASGAARGCRQLYGVFLQCG